jgi:hypothetical protein
MARAFLRPVCQHVFRIWPVGNTPLASPERRSASSKSFSRKLEAGGESGATWDSRSCPVHQVREGSSAPPDHRAHHERGSHSVPSPKDHPRVHPSDGASKRASPRASAHGDTRRLGNSGDSLFHLRAVTAPQDCTAIAPQLGRWGLWPLRRKERSRETRLRSQALADGQIASRPLPPSETCRP